MMHKAQRKKAKLRIGVAGPSGSGKTYSALLLAKGIAGSWDKVCIIDTENGSGELYSDLGEYNVITLQDFTGIGYTKAVKECEEAGMEVIVIDSMTHMWKSVLELVEKETQSSLSKNSYYAWGKVTPKYDNVIQRLLQSPCHIIITVRSKQDYAMVEGKNGKKEVQKLGMKPEIRDGFEYELTTSFDIAHSHDAKVSKDRTKLFNDEPFMISEKTGEALRDWNNAGL